MILSFPGLSRFLIWMKNEEAINVNIAKAKRKKYTDKRREETTLRKNSNLTQEEKVSRVNGLLLPIM